MIVEESQVLPVMAALVLFVLTQYHASSAPVMHTKKPQLWLAPLFVIWAAAMIPLAVRCEVCAIYQIAEYSLVLSADGSPLYLTP